VRCLQVAHNRRVGGVTRAEVLLNLGREDQLDVEGLRRLAGSITRYADGDCPDGAEVAGEGLEVVCSRPFGGAFVLEQRIRSHILICWLALLLVRLAERQTGQTWRNLRRELERLHLVTLAGAAGQVQQTTRLTDPQREILAQLAVEPPPRLTSLTPA